MNYSVNVPPSLSRFLDCLKGPGRRNLFAVAANALRMEVQRHLRANAPRHHIWAEKLGAPPTRLHEKGAARVTSNSSENNAQVVIPIPGIGRAFHDVTISPVAAQYLTVPVSAHAYSHRVGELVRMGWIVFRPKGHDVLMGKQRKSKDAPVSLYALKNQVKQRQDRSLLPSDDTITNTVSRAMILEIQRISRKAG